MRTGEAKWRCTWLCVVAAFITLSGCTGKKRAFVDGIAEPAADPLVPGAEQDSGSGLEPTSSDGDGIGDDSSQSTPAVDGAVAISVCGDGFRRGNEACDDGNRAAGDGCSDDCRVAEAGFSCAAPDRPCLMIARCGDGFIAATEQCDDTNTSSGDGCSQRCLIELGKKCEGQPSVCSDAECGNGIREGNEACDDGNVLPFDGCSGRCAKEPSCAGLSCVSACGDGVVVGEACDDGNLIDGDGCSSSCRLETGFVCVAEVPCEEVAGQCVLRVPIVFRDFADTHPDFGNNSCNARAPGAVAARLSPNGRPILNSIAAAQACLSTATNFDDWFTDNPRNTTLASELLLFDNGAGGYVNRFDAEGQQFPFVGLTTERDIGTSRASCSEVCLNEARDGLTPFNGPLRCEDLCRPLADRRDQLADGALIALQEQLNQALISAAPDAALAELRGQIATTEGQVSDLEQEITRCQADCQAQLDARAAPCIASCKPCSTNAARFCIGGQVLFFDGTPLFFPVDKVSGATAQVQAASVPVQFGPASAVPERTLFPGATSHNFSFTTEVEYRFQYRAETRATLTIGADDDIWVFLNGQLALDLGGVHAHEFGTLTVDAPAGLVTAVVADGFNDITPTGNFGLVEGNVYTLSIFHAERRSPFSSLLIALTGFESKTSRCSSICGDAVLGRGEECDDGINDGDYGECAAVCLLGPYCGDNLRQSVFGETCDVGPGGDASCRGCRVLAP